MSETYEVSLLRNVHAVDEKSAVSKEYAELKRKQARDNRKKGSGFKPKPSIATPQHHVGYENESPEKGQERSIDITV